MSSWLLVAVTVERVLAVKFPHKVQVLTTKRKTYTYIVAISIALACVYLPILFAMDLSASPDGSQVTCVAQKGWRLYFMDGVLPYLELALFACLPFAVLIVGNSIIISCIVTARIEAKKNLNVAQQNAGKIPQMTIILLLISFAFIILNLPICISNVLKKLDMWSSNDVSTMAIYYLVDTVCIILTVSNNSINFWLYCLSGPKFRRELASLFCSGKRSASKTIGVTRQTMQTSFSQNTITNAPEQ